jgi:hypothetical protein
MEPFEILRDSPQARIVDDSDPLQPSRLQQYFPIEARRPFDMKALAVKSTLVLLVALASLVSACSSALPKAPPGLPPDPKTVTSKDPGGNAYDPQKAALDRLANETWGWRNDKRDYFHFPLSDWQNWKRVKYWGLPTFVGFRYGDNHRAVAALWARPVQSGDAPTPATCIARFEEWATPLAQGYSTTISNTRDSAVSWKGKNDVLVRSLDATVHSLFGNKKYYGVVGATMGWPQVCLIWGYAFKVEDAEESAKKARDRYMTEAFQQLRRMKDGIPDPLE